MDDSIREGKQAREDVMTAMIEAGAVPGFEHHPLETEADLERLYAEVRDRGPLAIYVYRIAREVTERGRLSGATAAMIISGMPENVRGGVMFSFDGYADDPRELHQVPEVVEFCRGLLFGHDATDPRIEVGQTVFPYLIDEQELSSRVGRVAYDATGRLWVASVAFPDEVYFRSRESSSGWMRRIDLAAAIASWVLGEGPPPRV